MKKTLVLMLALMIHGCFADNLKAQTDNSDAYNAPMNSITASQQKTISSKRLAPQPLIQEANIMWKKTIIRQIDFRQKLNQVFYFPEKPTEDRKNLVTVLYEGVQNGDITPYEYKISGDKDNMTTPLTEAQFEEKGMKITLLDKGKGEPEPDTMLFEGRIEYVTRLIVKEDWYFDRNLSQLLVRIIAIAPVFVEKNDKGEAVASDPPCWIPYDEQTRSVLAKAFVFNRNNGASRLTYDEIFQKRIFDSYIIKEENVYDRYISEYAIGIDALLESDRIKQNLMDFEQSLWQY